MLGLFKIDDRKIKELLIDSVGAKEGDFNGQKMMCGTTVNPVVVVNPCPEFQSILVDTVTLVQNVWVDVLDEYFVRLHFFNINMATADETIEVEVTLDNQLMLGNSNVTFGTNYTVEVNAINNALNYLSGASDTHQFGRLGFIEARHCKIRVRKTTAAGANAFTYRLMYAKW